MDNEPCVLHLLPFPIKHLIWRDTEIGTGVKLISCLHFPVPDDRSMKDFPSWSIVTYLWFWCYLRLFLYPLFFSGIPGGEEKQLLTLLVLPDPTFAVLQTNKKYCVFGEKWGSFALGCYIAWRKTRDICHIAFYSVWITNQQFFFFSFGMEGAFKKLMKKIFWILLLKCPLLDLCISFNTLYAVFTFHNSITLFWGQSLIYF